MAHNQKLREQTAEISTQLAQNTQYLNALNAKLDRAVNQMAALGETLAAVVAHLGEDVVTAKITELRNKRHAEHNAKLDESLKFLVDSGIGVEAPEGAVIERTSFIVGDEISPDGTSMRFQHELSRLDEEGQKRYLGKKVGDEVTKKGFPTKVVIRAIYTLDMAKVQEHAGRKAAEKRAQAEAEAIAQAQGAAAPVPQTKE
jgi:hypothetical protein